MQGQRQPRKNLRMNKKLKEFKEKYGENATLFSLESSMTQQDALELYVNFSDFLSDTTNRINDASDYEILNIITEIIHYFNIALQILPGLSKKSGELTGFIKNVLKMGVGGGGGDWNSYSLQFGLPAGISLSLHFDT